MIIDLARGVPALHPERKGQLNRSPKKNWVEKAGGLPTYINSLATGIKRSNPGWPLSRVIATAVNMAKKMCATGRTFGGKAKVSPAIQAAACAAVAAWEKKKAGARVSMTAREDKLTDRDYLELRGLVWDEDYDENQAAEFDDMDFEALLTEEADLKVQAPLSHGEKTKVGRKLYRKQILPIGAQVKYGEDTLDFSEEFVDQLLKNHQEGVFDQVPLVLADDANRHTEDPEKFIGELKGIEKNGDSLDGLFEVTDRGAQILDDNPRLGTSPRLIYGYVRGADQKAYDGAVLRHVSATMNGYVPGQQDEWSTADLTEQPEGEVVDLTAHEYIPKGGVTVENKNDTPAEEQVPKGDEVKTVSLTEEQYADLSAKAEKGQQAYDLAEQAITDRRNLESQLNSEKVEVQLTQYLNAGVPKAVVDLARPLLTGKAKEGEGENEKIVDLTDVMVAQNVREMLDTFQGTVKFGEDGRVDLSVQDGETEEDAVLRELGDTFGN